MRLRPFLPVFDCYFGHTTHHDRRVVVVLDGPAEQLHDTPSIPPRLALRFPMLVYDWARYQTPEPGYCPGRDEVSKGIMVHGRWETAETLTVLDILTGSGVVYDFGAHIGWYTLIAGLTGHPVVAFEPDPENLRILNLNLAMNRLAADVHPLWVDETVPPFPPAGPVRLIKIDIEGHSGEAVRVCVPILDRQLIDYLLVEVSPVFVDDSAETVATIVDRGYRPFLIPDPVPLEEMAADPLGVVRECPLVSLDFPQRDVLFIREDLL